MKSKRFLMFLSVACFALLFALFSAAAATAQEEQEEDAFGNIMNTGYVQIGDVSVCTPAAGAPCKISAKITLIGAEDFENLAVKSAKLTYVVNGERLKAQSVDMTASGDVYSAEIPGQPAGTKVAFYITVADTLGNTSTEALPVDSPDNSAGELVAGVPDVDNSADTVADSADILGTYAGYDADHIYVGYDLQGDIFGGTLEPPNVQIYGIKISNPDLDPGEGLMVGKMWIFLPIANDKTLRDKFLSALPGQITSAMNTLPKDQTDRVKDTGMLVLNISKLMGGDWNSGLIFDAEPTQLVTGDKKHFVGNIKRTINGDNPSGFVRIIVFTAANASLDNFMPIPLNCSHFIQLYTRDHEYQVK